MSRSQFDEVATQVLSAIGLQLISIVLKLIVSGELSLDGLPFAKELGIHNEAQAKAFLKKLEVDAIV